ncbi:MAG: hypothetical protein JNL09_05390 [Anaerolineales bacterium]|nr:hypothetical protein [Anaerolineales bacterium]
MQQLLKPTWPKIILALALLFVSSWLWRMYVVATISDTFPLGFPLQFFLAWGPCLPNRNCSEFNGWWLIVDVLFWYAISAGLVEWVKRRANQ